MILLDTHIWIWWVDGSARLRPAYQRLLAQEEPQGLAIAAISVWEVAKLVEKGKLAFTLPVDEWVRKALAYPGITLINLTPDIALASTQLPGDFHPDPADQLIVATARVMDLALLTEDARIQAYPHVRTL